MPGPWSSFLRLVALRCKHRVAPRVAWSGRRWHASGRLEGGTARGAARKATGNSRARALKKRVNGRPCLVCLCVSLCVHAHLWCTCLCSAATKSGDKDWYKKLDEKVVEDCMQLGASCVLNTCLQSWVLYGPTAPCLRALSIRVRDVFECSLLWRAGGLTEAMLQSRPTRSRGTSRTTSLSCSPLLGRLPPFLSPLPYTHTHTHTHTERERERERERTTPTTITIHTHTQTHAHTHSGSNLRKSGGMDTGQVGFHDTNMLFKAKVHARTRMPSSIHTRTHA